MAKPFIQCSFNSGEWAPNLWARVDLDKYRSGAAVLENFFVDYRGGATTRSGSKYILKGFKDTQAIRLIPFQAAIDVGFALEFGDEYVRFHANGAPVLESTINITAATKANPCHITAANSYSNGDWVYITDVSGMTQLNGKYYIVSGVSGAGFDLLDLFGNNVNSTGYSTYISGGHAARVYTLVSPYAATDLALLKFVQNIDVLILTHPDYVPYALTFASAASWTLAAIAFGATISAPNNPTVTSTLAGSNFNYAYLVTAVDGSGQESNPSVQATLASRQDMRTSGGTNTISWDPVPGASGYNVYKALQTQSNPVPIGSFFGFIGFVTGTSLGDSNITPDFSQPPPTPDNPFETGSKVTAVTITNAGTYTTAPNVTFSAPGGGGTTATGTAVLGAANITSVGAAGTGYNVGDTITLADGVVVTVATLTGAAPNGVASATITTVGSATVLPANPVAQTASSGAGSGATFNLNWGVTSVTITNGGTRYGSAPTVTFSAGAATATATIGPASVGNPSVPTFFQQRLCLAAPDSNPETLYFSQPGNYYNYNISTPSQDDDAITAPIVTGQLSNIKALVPQPGGLIVLTDGISYLLNGGSLGSPITPSTITANPQSYIGANDIPPIVVNFDILSVPAKGSSVRDNTYNFYANVFTGQDISAISSHLFFGYKLTEWAWAEEPYKIVWAIRNDGTMLSLTFIKEQEFTAWTHHNTDGGNGTYRSVCTIVEAASVGFQNFVYTVVQRNINSVAVQYIEYFPERPTSDDPQDYWTVDCAVGYVGPLTTTFQGAEFLSGKTVTGLADGKVITPFVMPANGSFTLPEAASKVKIGLAFECNLQTLYIELGNQPSTVQSKVKQLPQATIRVTKTLGLKIGSDQDNLVTMKDLVVGNIGSMTNEVVTGLVTGDARTVLDSKWQEPGQVYIRQDQPFPATILGYIPQVNVGQDK